MVRDFICFVKGRQSNSIGMTGIWIQIYGMSMSSIICEVDFYIKVPDELAIHS